MQGYFCAMMVVHEFCLTKLKILPFEDIEGKMAKVMMD